MFYQDSWSMRTCSNTYSTAWTSIKKGICFRMILLACLEDTTGNRSTVRKSLIFSNTSSTQLRRLSGIYRSTATKASTMTDSNKS